MARLGSCRSGVAGSFPFPDGRLRIPGQHQVGFGPPPINIYIYIIGFALFDTWTAMYPAAFERKRVRFGGAHSGENQGKNGRQGSPFIYYTYSSCRYELMIKYIKSRCIRSWDSEVCWPSSAGSVTGPFAWQVTRPIAQSQHKISFEIYLL